MSSHLEFFFQEAYRLTLTANIDLTSKTKLKIGK